MLLKEQGKIKVLFSLVREIMFFFGVNMPSNVLKYQQFQECVARVK